ncbi:MAG: TMEM14 family protein [Cyanobacteria bacterium P01_H01_bin.58]
MAFATISTFVYGVLAIVGGFIGFKQAGSKASLISGIITGILLVIAGTGLTQAQSWAIWLAIAVVALLVVVFIGRLIKTRKFMPAGLMVLVGTITVVSLLTALG